MTTAPLQRTHWSPCLRILQTENILTRALCCALLAAPCAALDAPERYQRGCETPRLVLRSDFPGGRVSGCSVEAPDHLLLQIAPEDAPPINDSAWFAFRMEPREPGPVTLTLRYEGGTHRYTPKLREAGGAWTQLAPQALRALPGKPGGAVRFAVELRSAPLLVAAQELILPGRYREWERRIAAHSAVRLARLGESAEGRILNRLEIGRGRAGVLLLLGRQHPPETTGALALFAFTERLLEGDSLARAFRARFLTHLFPLLNPDGVVRGHWRNNTRGADLNRDWGGFLQPETRQVRDFLETRLRPGRAPLSLVIDFHSTRRNLFYTQLDEEPVTPPFFIRDWIACALPRLPADYAFSREARRTSSQANSKNYFYRRYGIPAITYEAGDETPRPAIRAAARTFAETMMAALLRRGCGESSGQLLQRPSRAGS